MENKQNEKIGELICELRKLQNLTQKNLAEKLNITDKAVSKWERGISCPDISLLIPLSNVLGVTPGELLIGKKETASSQTTVKNTVDEVLEYSNKSIGFKIERMKRNILAALSAAFLIAVITCLICDYFITGQLTWSLIVIISSILSWFLMLPFLKGKGRIIERFLILLSFLIIPYLAAMSWILSLPAVLYLGTCISVISVAGLWCIYATFLRFHNRKLQATGISFLIIIPLAWGINHIVAYFQESVTDWASDMMNILITLSLAIVCFGIDYFITHRNK